MLQIEKMLQEMKMLKEKMLKEKKMFPLTFLSETTTVNIWQVSFQMYFYAFT